MNKIKKFLMMVTDRLCEYCPYILGSLFISMILFITIAGTLWSLQLLLAVLRGW